MSRTAIDNFLWNVKLYLMHKYGCDQAESDIYPLVWWINTGRASTYYIHIMLDKKPYMIARRLHNSKDRSTEGVVRNIKAYLDR